MTGPRLSFGLIVLNGMPFLPYLLESVYPHAHQIIVVEGAVRRAWEAATPDGHSTDGTVEALRRFPDPEGKLVVVQREGFWPEKTEMSNAYVERCTGDYIWQLDVDEFYRGEDIERVRTLLAERPELHALSFKTLNFWGGFEAIMAGGRLALGDELFHRLFKFRPGWRFRTHRPPTLVDEAGTDTRRLGYLSGAELARHGIYLYHYSYVFPEQVRQKMGYYLKMGWRGVEDEGWVEHYWSQLGDPLRVHPDQRLATWLVPFEGEHPRTIQRLREDLATGRLRVEQRPTEDIQRYLASPGRRWLAARGRIRNLIPGLGLRLQRRFAPPLVALRDGLRRRFRTRRTDP